MGDAAILHCRWRRWLPSCRDSHSSLAVVAVVFCRDDSVTRGYCGHRVTGNVRSSSVSTTAPPRVAPYIPASLGGAKHLSRSYNPPYKNSI